MKPRWRWECGLCPARGVTDTEEAALAGWRWHYQSTHREGRTVNGNRCAARETQRVEFERSAHMCENETAGTGAPTPARPNRSSTSIGPKEPRLMADATHSTHVCAVPLTTDHTGGDR